MSNSKFRVTLTPSDRDVPPLTGEGSIGEAIDQVTSGCAGYEDIASIVLTIGEAMENLIETDSIGQATYHDMAPSESFTVIVEEIGE